MPKYYMVAGHLTRERSGSPQHLSGIKVIDESIIDLLFEHNLIVSHANNQHDHDYGGYQKTSAEKWAGNPRIYINSMGVIAPGKPGGSPLYKAFSTVKEAVDAAKSSTWIFSSIPDTMYSIFEITTSKTLDESQKITVPSPDGPETFFPNIPFEDAPEDDDAPEAKKGYEISACYIPGFYNVTEKINGIPYENKYRAEALKRVAEQPEITTGELVLFGLLSLLLIPLPYFIHLLYKRHERSAAKELIQQVDAYLTEEGELYKRDDQGNLTSVEEAPNVVSTSESPHFNPPVLAAGPVTKTALVPPSLGGEGATNERKIL